MNLWNSHGIFFQHITLPDLNIFKFERNRTELFTLILHSYELALSTRFVVHRVQSYIFLEKKKNDNQNSVFSL